MRWRSGCGSRSSYQRINGIAREKRGITAHTAVRLSRFLWNHGQFWLNPQGAYVLSRVKAEHGADLNRTEPPRSGEAADLNSGHEGFKLTGAPFVAAMDDKGSMSFTPF
jgi:hypothetical protein